MEAIFSRLFLVERIALGHVRTVFVGCPRQSNEIPVKPDTKLNFPVSLKIDIPDSKCEIIVPSSWILSPVVIGIMISRERIKGTDHAPTKAKIICCVTHVTTDI